MLSFPVQLGQEKRIGITPSELLDVLRVRVGLTPLILASLSNFSESYGVDSKTFRRKLVKRHRLFRIEDREGAPGPLWPR